MTSTPGSSWEPEPIDPATAPPSSPYAPAGEPVPPAPGYAALYPSPGAGPAVPGYAALYQDPGGAYAYPPAVPFRQPGAPGPMPPNHLALAIVALFLFWIPGLVAVIYSTQVESRWRAGDYAGARQASESARRWGRGTVVVSVALLAAGLFMGIVMSFLAA